jgi:hypothetical protein
MRFILINPIHLSANASIPTGATGRITRYDQYHLLLSFDVFHRCLSWCENTLILDEYDTEPEIWAAIGTYYFDVGEVKCEKTPQGTIFANCT